jgi:hypothetical protein
MLFVDAGAQEQVSVIGYPTGGDNTSITSGGVSRVEVTLYVHAASHLMAIQTTQPSTQVGGRRFSMVFQRKLADCVFGGCPVAPQPVIYT